MRPLLLPSLLGFLLSACTQPAPDDVLFFLGTLKMAGQPQAHAPLVLERSFPDPFDCPLLFQSETEPGWESFATTTTDVEGDFFFEFYRYQTRRGLGADAQQACFQVRLPGADGTAGRLRFQHISGDSEMTPLEAWSAGLEGALEEGSLVFRSAAAPQLPRVHQTEHRLRLADGSGNTVWEAPAGEGDLRLPAGLAEDLGSLRASVRLYVDGDMGRGLAPISTGATTYEVEAISPILELTVPSSVPASRGASCWVGDEEHRPCVLTDGELTYARLEGSLETSQLELRWEEATMVSSVVLRELGFYGSKLRIELETTPGGWVEAGTVVPPLNEWGEYDYTSAYAVLTLPAPVQASALRLTVEQGTLVAAQEVSVLR